MKNKIITGGLSALALCAVMGGIYEGAAIAGDRSSDGEARMASVDAAKATKALTKRDSDKAVRYAELAVGLSPRSADYRALLGQAYMLAGRFGSARSALADALTLSPGDGKIALNLALAQVADGDWSGARATLDANSGSIPVADRGLAIALAGDPVSAVELLMPVARQPGADAKLRQNLALSLAMAGRWQDAKVVAGMDLSPAETDKRIVQWAAFARPAAKADQVAALLGVTPAADPGQPVALALNATTAPGVLDTFMPKTPAPAAVASAASDAAAPVQGAVPVAAPAPRPAPAIVAPVASVTPGTAAPAPKVSSVVFAQRAEIVQPLPVKPVAGMRSPIAKPVAVKVAKASFVQPVTAAKTTPGASTVSVRSAVGKGNFFVQLGAYDNASVARDGWARASRAYSGFAGHAPQGMSAKVGGKNFYRLSVGGFDRAGAAKVCKAYRARGGNCFVRASAGDAAVDWAAKKS
jgi:Flp pilus assembly protein TadD